MKNRQTELSELQQRQKMSVPVERFTLCRICKSFYRPSLPALINKTKRIRKNDSSRLEHRPCDLWKIRIYFNFNH